MEHQSTGTFGYSDDGIAAVLGDDTPLLQTPCMLNGLAPKPQGMFAAGKAERG
jgi:hypothetical protein